MILIFPGFFLVIMAGVLLALANDRKELYLLSFAGFTAVRAARLQTGSGQMHTQSATGRIN